MLLEVLFGLAFGQSVARTVPLHVRASYASYGACEQHLRSSAVQAPAMKPMELRSSSGNVARTPLSPTEARQHLEWAYFAVLRVTPETRTLSLLMAQWALETGRGQSMWGYNFGGIKAISGGAAFLTDESFGRRKRRSVHQFRTYGNALEGAKDYIRTLSFDFPKAFEAAQSGEAARFAQALFEERYFTGDPKDYERAITRLADEYERRWRELRGKPQST